MPLQPLIQLSRGGTPECLHFGAIAVVNTRGQLVAQAGDPHWLSFTRSTLKALQALPFVEAGGPQQFGFSQAQIAMLCASHNGEDMHVQAADAMLAQAGQSYKALRCGCHVPGLFTLLDQAPPAGLQFDERHNNCSGKHAGLWRTACSTACHWMTTPPPTIRCNRRFAAMWRGPWAWTRRT